MTNLNNLTDSDLDQVSGGDCKAAVCAMVVFDSFATILAGLGKSAASAYYAGVAKGTFDTGCPPK